MFHFDTHVLTDQLIIKAHRYRQPHDLHNAAGHILKTICHAKSDAQGFRDVRSDEDVSVFDTVKDEATKYNYGHQDEKGMFRPKPGGDGTFPRRMFYKKADELEDAVLIPEELEADGEYDHSKVGQYDKLTGFTANGINSRKWIRGEESDSDDLDEEEDEDEDEEYEDDGEEYVLDDEILSDEGWETDDDDMIMPNPDNSSVEKSWGKKRLEYFQGLGVSAEVSAIFYLMDKMEEQMLKAERLPRHQQMKAECNLYLDKEKSKIFKGAWHTVDFVPGAQAQYAEAKAIQRAAERYSRRSIENKQSFLGWELCLKLRKHSATTKDVHKAVAKVAAYFDPFFFTNEDGTKFVNSSLFKQHERAKNPPPHGTQRSHVSCKYRKPEFWKEFDDIRRSCANDVIEHTPVEWDDATRPIIAKCKSTSRRDRVHILIIACSIQSRDYTHPCEYTILWASYGVQGSTSA